MSLGFPGHRLCRIVSMTTVTYLKVLSITIVFVAKSLLLLNKLSVDYDTIGSCAAKGSYHY